MDKRLDSLKKLMNEKGVSALIITDPKNMYYYSGFFDGEGYVVIGENINAVVTDSRYTQYAESVCKGFDVLDITKTKLSDILPKGTAVGFEDQYVSYAYYQKLSQLGVELVASSDIVFSPRKVKDENEIKSIKKAAQIADKAFSYILSIMKEGMTEIEIASEIDCFMRKCGARATSFPTIVATGERASLPHAIPSQRSIKRGELLVMDFGCTIDGYCSDMTRTVAIGDISEEKEKVYNTVLNAQEMALDKIRANLTGSEVDKVARDIIDASFPHTFTHSLGHGVGLDIHEMPNLSPKSHSLLTEGNVVTVEPGIYIPAFCGVRIEDLVVLKKDGISNLTTSPKQLIKI